MTEELYDRMWENGYYDLAGDEDYDEEDHYEDYDD